MSNQPYGYDPCNPGPADGSAFFLNSSGEDCYYDNSNNGCFKNRIGIFPDGSEYKQTEDELRQYIVSLESTRKLEDLVNVKITRNVRPGDTLVFNYLTGNWELKEFISGGEW